MVLSLPIVIVPEVKAQNTWLYTQTLFTDFLQFRLEVYNEMVDNAMTAYGIISGVYFMGISAAMGLMFWKIMRLIDDEGKLSETLRE